MTKLWDDLIKNMKDWSSVAVEKAEEVSKIAVAKTEELTKISKIKIEIHQLQRDLSKTYENLGRLVSHHAKEENMVNFTGNKEFYRSLEKIEETQLKITDKEGKIQKVKDEFNTQEEVSSATELNIEAESVVEEPSTSEEESHTESSDSDIPTS
jgi:hypothetical protein